MNGSIGTVTGFHSQHSGTHIYSINVQFTNGDKPVQIERMSCTFEVLKCIFYTRKQFPIMAAFAITHHKSQGLSLSAAIVDAGPSCFGSGMSYVALSRVTSVNGLHLIDFDKAKILCNIKAVAEYNRLRTTYTPHLGPINPKSSKNGTEVTDRITKDTTSNIDKTAEREVNTVKNRKRQTTSTDKSNQPPSRKHKLLHGKDAVSHTTAETEVNVSTVAQAKTTVAELSQTDTASLTTQLQTFDCCSVTSLSESFQAEVCDRLNLRLHPAGPISIHRSGSQAARELTRLIYTKTQQPVNVTIASIGSCLLYTSPSPRDGLLSRMPSSA